MQSPHATKDNTIIGSVEHAAPMLRNIAHHYRQDYDDLYQVAAETALKVYDQAQEARNPVGYIQRTIRNAVLDYAGATSPDHRIRTFADYYHVESLDAPLTRESDLSLYDMVAIDSSGDEENRDFSCLYAVLDSLPDIYREVVCMRFGLCGYAPHRHSEIARILGIPGSTVRNRFHDALRMLRNYAEQEHF